MELHQLLRDAVRQLTDAEIPAPRADAELLACWVLGLSRGELTLRALTGLSVSAPEVERLRDLVDERCRRVPLQHLTGSAPFRSLELRVGPGVFIPRPETESVVDAVLEQLRLLLEEGIRHPRIVDLGTGSGAIAAAVAAECPAAEVHAVELSEEAVAWARMNIEALPGSAAQVTLHHGDLRRSPELLGQLSGTFDVVVSNPPYIPADMVPTEVEVREHDPQLALYGGGDGGLELPFAVVAAAEQLLRPGGWFIMEHAEVQAGSIMEHCVARPLLESIRTHQDLTGRDRATSAVLSKSERGDVAQWRA